LGGENRERKQSETHRKVGEYWTHNPTIEGSNLAAFIGIVKQSKEAVKKS
jgi:hypothetical protein